MAKKKNEDDELRAHQEDFDARAGEQRLGQWAKEIRKDLPYTQLNARTAKEYEKSGHIGDFQRAGEIYLALGDYQHALDALKTVRDKMEARPTYHDPRAPSKEMQLLDSKISALEAVTNHRAKKKGRFFGIFSGLLLITSILFSVSSITGFTVADSVSVVTIRFTGVLLFVVGLVLAYTFLRKK